MILEEVCEGFQMKLPAYFQNIQKAAVLIQMLVQFNICCNYQFISWKMVDEVMSEETKEEIKVHQVTAKKVVRVQTQVTETYLAVAVVMAVFGATNWFGQTARCATEIFGR